MARDLSKSKYIQVSYIDFFVLKSVFLLAMFELPISILDRIFMLLKVAFSGASQKGHSLLNQRKMTCSSAQKGNGVQV